MKEQQPKDKIIMRVDSELKTNFKKKCLELGLKMTDVLTASMVEFIKESKNHK